MDGEFPRASSGAGILDLQQPVARSLPLVLASPHSGAEYPADFLAASRLDPLALRRSEDSFVDELFGGVNKLKTPGFDPKWKDVNLSTQVPGLERFQAAQEWLDRASPSKQSGHP